MPSPAGSYPGYPAYPLPAGARAADKRGVPWYVWLIGGCLGVVAIAAVGCVVLVGVFTGLTLRAINQQAVSDTTTRTLPVTGTPTLAIQDGAGRITITQGTTDQVSIRMTRTARASTRQDAQAGLNGIVVTVTRQDNSITIGTNFTQGGGLLNNNREVDLAITTPHQTQLRVTGTSGTVEVAQISGQIQVSEDEANITTNGVTFAADSRVELQSGNVAIQGALASGASLDVQVDQGTVALTLPADTPAHLNASANLGSIAIKGWPITPVRPSGNSAGMTASGDLGANPTGSLTVQVNLGNITLSAQ